RAPMCRAATIWGPRGWARSPAARARRARRAWRAIPSSRASFGSVRSTSPGWIRGYRGRRASKAMAQHVMGEGPLHDAAGHLTDPGYATREVRRYDRSLIAAHPARIKEWDYYCVLNADFGLALT